MSSVTRVLKFIDFVGAAKTSLRIQFQGYSSWLIADALRGFSPVTQVFHTHGNEFPAAFAGENNCTSEVLAPH